MMNQIKTSLLIVMALLAASCSTLKIVEVDPETGFFPGGKRATVVKAVSIDLDDHRELLLVPNGDFTHQMASNIGFFDEVIDFSDLETQIVKAELTDVVPSVVDRIGLNNAAKNYKPFLWLRWDSRQQESKKYQQLVLTDPATLEDIFVAETLLDYVWAGVNDQNNYYPMMNSLIDYLKENSASF